MKSINERLADLKAQAEQVGVAFVVAHGEQDAEARKREILSYYEARRPMILILLGGHPARLGFMLQALSWVWIVGAPDLPPGSSTDQLLEALPGRIAHLAATHCGGKL